MTVVQRVGEYVIVQKRNGRYGVRARKRQWVQGDDKLRVLAEAGLADPPAEKREAEEASANEAVAESADAAVEESQESAEES